MTIPPGVHYLALEATGKGGLRLLALASEQVRKRKLYAPLTDRTKPVLDGTKAG